MQMVTETQQPWKLSDRMAQEGIRHGETVRADIDDVMVYRKPRKRASREEVLAQVRFCAVSRVRVRERLGGISDKNRISQDVYLDERLPVPHITTGGKGEEKRYYRLTNVIISTNGRTTVAATPETQFIRADKALAHAA